MKILALITARGGSKRLPGKNIRPLGGKPLIVWSIDVAKDIHEICDILVSTDDPAIATVSKESGAYVPWLRPAELATDTASSIDVALHALNWYEAEKGTVDGLLLLQPTSPFRSRDTVRRGIELFQMHQHNPVLGVSPAKHHPKWCYQILGETMRPFLGGDSFHLRSQDIPPAYAPNGSFYLIAPDDLRKLQSFHIDKMVPLVINKPQESIDVDTEWDWMVAEAVLRNHQYVGTR